MGNLSKSPTVFNGGQGQFMYGKQMAQNNGGAVTSPRLQSNENQNMSGSMSFIPNQQQQRGSPQQQHYMGFNSQQMAGNQNFMMQPHPQFPFNQVNSYAHMGIGSQQFTPNLSSLLNNQ